MKKIVGWAKGQWFFRIKKIQVWRLERRDGGEFCSYCHCRFTETGNRCRTLDHRVARAKGGKRHRLSNLLFSCSACNRQKATTPEVAFRTSAWLAQRRETLQHEAKIAARRVALM